MKSSESLKEFNPAFIKAQIDMETVAKSSSNPFFKSKYADINSVIEAIKEALNKNGLAFSQHPVSGDKSVGVSTRIMHESGEWIEEEFVMPLMKPDPQASGSTITYARRYALQAMCGLQAVDADAERGMVR